MTLNTAYALALQVAGRIHWPLAVGGAVALAVAGALAVASAIDLITGFSLTIPDKVIVEVEAIHDELEIQKKAESSENHEHEKQALVHARTPLEARLITARAEEAPGGTALSAPFRAAARRAGPTAAGAVIDSAGPDDPLPLHDAQLVHADD